MRRSAGLLRIVASLPYNAGLSATVCCDGGVPSSRHSAAERHQGTGCRSSVTQPTLTGAQDADAILHRPLRQQEEQARQGNVICCASRGVPAAGGSGTATGVIKLTANGSLRRTALGDHCHRPLMSASWMRAGGGAGPQVKWLLPLPLTGRLAFAARECNVSHASVCGAEQERTTAPKALSGQWAPAAAWVLGCVPSGRRFSSSNCNMTDLLQPELLELDGRVYRVLASLSASTSGRRPASHSQQLRQKHYDAEEDAGEDGGSWGGGGGDAAGGGAGGEDEEQASVPIRQEGDSFVARMRLDSEVRRALQCTACRAGCAMPWVCGSSSGRPCWRHPCATAAWPRPLCHCPLLLQLFPVLIGRQGATKRRVEDDTGASISIPGRGAQVHRVGGAAPA